MPKLSRARPPQDATEERQIRKLASSRHAPGDWIRRAQMIVRSWDGLRTSAIAAEVGCHPQTVRERLVRFNAEGLNGLGDRPGAGRKPRLTEASAAPSSPWLLHHRRGDWFATTVANWRRGTRSGRRAGRWTH